MKNQLNKNTLIKMGLSDEKDKTQYQSNEDLSKTGEGQKFFLWIEGGNANQTTNWGTTLLKG